VFDVDELVCIPRAYVQQRDLLRCVGPDTNEFLQGQLSQDVKTLSDASSSWSFLLNPNGKVCVWLRVSRISEDEYILDMEQGWGRLALERLNRFKIRIKCEIELSQVEAIRILGKGSKKLKEDSKEKGEINADAGWPNLEGYDLIDPTAAPPSICENGTKEEYEYLRISNAIPSMGAEITEGIIPAETNLVSRSVSFTKGCYTGQELVARLDSRGNKVAKNLCKLTSQGSFSSGSNIYSKEREVGAVTSSVSSEAGTIGLGYLSRSFSIPGAAEIDGVLVQIDSASD
tara:strand:- start:24 stop:884 length:861 start_codon:yes stop_codon:yes gene_type:complete